ncbi:TetR/AcrR family transcriptional regulator [Mycobacterium shimoidei]|uniref:TetR family transcriptional regulator [Nocardia brasiliensis ATCC] n=1 Tax=Mycobacterium shimoidei TaxID=29313 RepID=A0A1E3TN98_MYCSH|nr:TetR/AcrR family transcriptional regulator [Mycobacterium shimoidei]MCV7259816.1 TetR/AcrR family transcriptional regulator [Mycobacterium shimoidei]ODR15117.1 transcriptional regulator [Mycobacterium shimoidei]ORW79284.1 transcriptional regulator [Mycobacterium shimoidei]SRX94639.1 TetR family transcriptional regulator [Nocardia brasiliensis ATCC] [Mycobacterium shimoidei]
MVAPPAQAESPARLARREQILQAARAVIEEYGPDALTGQIAERAGLARPNVYRHFSSKDELDLAVARSAYRELRAEVLKRVDLSGSPREVIRAPIAAQAVWADTHPNLYRFLVSRGYQRSSHRRNSEGHDFMAQLAEVGARYFPRFGDNPDTAVAIVVGLTGMINASILDWLSRRADTREQLIDRLTTHAWLIIDHYLREIGVCLDPVAQIRHNDSVQG